MNNIDSLVKYAEGNPKDAAEVWNQLYDESMTLEERITISRGKLKSYDDSLAIGAPLFGYLLAAFDYTKYPLYKGEVYQETKATYEITYKMGSVEKNYSSYFDICEVMLDYFQKENEDITMFGYSRFLLLFDAI